MRRRPLLKVCGVTRPADAVRAAELGYDLVGLNFHPPSPRYLAPRRAVEVARAVAGRALLVGVFVDRSPAEVEEIAALVGLDLVQLHGDETPEEAALYGSRALPVLRLPAAAPPPAAVLAARLSRYPQAWGFLFDVRHETLHGGTGESWDWGAVAGLADAGEGGSALAGRPLLVAGGIAPRNARRALAESGAAGLDVCSGVESSPGTKDPDLLSALAAAARGFTSSEEITDGESPSAS